MRRIVRSTLIIASLYMVSINQSHAFDLDMTVEDEIRKNYSPSQLVDDVNKKGTALEKKIQSTPVVVDENLPALPSILKQANSTKKPDVTSSIEDSPKIVQPNYKTLKNGTIKIKAGTSFDVKSSVKISDWQRKGTKVSFTLQGSKSSRRYFIPPGTTFYGEIINSHQPQITCNGGLVVIKVDTMIYKGQRVPITAYVTRADDKKIFFNNIKGERNYIKTTWKKGSWGRALFGKMAGITADLGSDGPTLILAPFPFAYGTVCLGLNTITSPICAFFSKGGHISIPAGSTFRIKLVEDAMIN